MYLIRRFFPIHRFNYSNKAIKILTISDTIFYSGMALTEVIFSIFILAQIKGATVVNLGIANSLFMTGVFSTEPFFSKFFDIHGEKIPFYGFIIGNLMKSVFRMLFIFINSIGMYYIVFFLLGISHSIEFPSFAKLFSKHLDRGFESSEWGIKDVLVSLGNIITLFLSGYIIVIFGYKVLFVLSSLVMLIAGVLIPWVYKKEFIQN